MERIKQEIFGQALLDSIPGNVAILDEAGEIIKTNKRWVNFNNQNDGELSSCCQGVNYLQVCRAAYQAGAEDAKTAAEGIKAVITGEQELFEFEYPCHSEEEDRWFNMRVTPLTEVPPHTVVVFHINITKRKLAEEKVQAKTNELTKRIDEAQKIHQILLPPAQLELESADIASFYQPAEDLGGDFLNFHQLEDKLIFYVVDVSGHGLDGAMLNLLVQERLTNYFELPERENNLTPQQIISEVHDLYSRKEFPADYFLCIEVGVIDLTTGRLLYSNAGFHISPLVISDTGQITLLEVSGLPISAVIDFNSHDLKTREAVLKAGHKLFFTTDGLVEVETEANRYGVKRLQQVLQDNHYLDCQLLKEAVVRDLNQHKNKEAVGDDVTFMAVEIKETDRFNVSLESELGVLEKLKKEATEFLENLIETVDPVLIGLQEMVANAIEHGNQFSADKQVKIEIVVRSNYLRVMVADEGPGFCWDNCLQEDITLEDFTDRGRGIALTKEAVDEVHYNCPGNRVNLIKFR